MPYGYDKLKSHCCGCPNQVCSGAEKSNVKIEEERPDVKLESEHKDADSSSVIRHPKKPTSIHMATTWQHRMPGEWKAL